MTRKFFKPTALLILSLLLGFSSCISEGIVPNPEPESDDLMLTLRLSKQPGTRNNSDGSLDMTGEKVHFKGGDLYFVNRDNNIVKHIKIERGTGVTTGDFTLSDKDPDYDPHAVINFDDLTDGAKGVDILLPRTTRRVIIVGNNPGRDPHPVTGSINGVRDPLIDVYHQWDADDVNIYAESAIIYNSSTDGWSATLELYPTVARIQIGSLTAGEGLESFELKGIFIDNYFKRAHVHGGIPADNNNLENERGEDPNKFNGTAPHDNLFTWYSTAKTMVGDIITPAAPGSNNFSNPDKRPFDPKTIVWGYNVFAEREDATGASNTTPRIILRLANVKLEDGTLENSGNDDRFVTFSGFYSAVKGHISRFMAGDVYDFQNLAIERADLSPNPNKNPRVGQVLVDTQEWNGDKVGIFGFRQPNPRSVAVPDGETYTFDLAPATYNGKTDVAEYLWQTSATPNDPGSWKDVTNGYPTNWSSNPQYTTQSIDIAYLDGIWYRRLAKVNEGEPNELIITSAAAEVKLANLPTPGLSPDGPFCGAGRIEIKKPDEWNETQWNALTADHITLTGGTINHPSGLTVIDENTYVFFIPEPTQVQGSSLTYEINFTGSIGGLDILEREEALKVTVSRPETPPAGLSLTGQNCFDVVASGNMTRHRANFDNPITYTLNNVPANATNVSWEVTVDYGDTKLENIRIATLTPGSNSATVRFNASLLEQPLRDNFFGNNGVRVTIYAYVTVPGGDSGSGCTSTTHTEMREIRIKDAPCCVRIDGNGTTSDGACWAYTNLRSAREFADLPTDLGMSGTTQAGPPTQYCPEGWRIPTRREGNALGVSQVTTMPHVNRVTLDGIPGWFAPVHIPADLSLHNVTHIFVPVRSDLLVQNNNLSWNQWMGNSVSFRIDSYYPIHPTASGQLRCVLNRDY
jgi:hypothetical protein